MSGYARGPNVSQYIANLNAIPQSSAQQPQDPLSGFVDDDLALFTNTELFDFDPEGGVKQEDYFHENGKTHRSKPAGKPDNSDFAPNAGNFNMFDPSQPMAPLNTNFPNAGNFDPQLFQSPQSATFPSHAQMNAPSPTSQAAGQKRAHSSASPAASVEDVARMAAEEDKRRRNTAASARFRVKKKQREAALEKSAKENSDKVEQLQKRVNELELENKWLRELVVQKDGSTKKGASEGTEAEPETISNKQLKRGIGTDIAA